MTRNDTDIRIRTGKVRDRAPRAERVVRPARGFLADVHRAIRRAGGDPNKLAGRGKASGRYNARGRGAVERPEPMEPARRRDLDPRPSGDRESTDREVEPAAWGRSFVSGKAVDAHLRYLQRDGVTLDGEKGQVYARYDDVADGRAFLDRVRQAQPDALSISQ